MAARPLLSSEQSETLASLTQRERIDVVLNVLIRRLERDCRSRVYESAIAAVEASDTKKDALERLKREMGQ